MIIGILNEGEIEKRIAITPEIVKKLSKQSVEIIIENNLGEAAGFAIEEFVKSGAAIKSRDVILQTSDILLTVDIPNETTILKIKKAILIGNLGTRTKSSNLEKIQKIKAYDLEKLPRSTRAQSMDVLSSQANISGYKSVLLALEYYQKFMPMLMTAAGTVKPAKVIVLGVGVAGLQAIATAKRLGAMVEASDVRPAVKDQVESLGAKFIDVPFETSEEKDIAEGKGGYAEMMPKAWMDRQSKIVSEAIKKSDIVITTASIPGKKPPILINSTTVNNMKMGSVIVDIAGGNCELTKVNEVLQTKTTTIIGFTNLAKMLPHDASILYSKNLNNFLDLIIDNSGNIKTDSQDELVESCKIN